MIHLSTGCDNYLEKSEEFRSEGIELFIIIIFIPSIIKCMESLYHICVFWTCCIMKGLETWK